MNKKALKIITALCLIVLVVFIASSVFAADDPTKLTVKGDDTFDKAGQTILGWIRGIGTIVAVGVLMVLGVKYMMGSASEKAEYKKTMIPYFIGAILLAAAVNIAGFIFTAGNKLADSATEKDASISVVEMV